LAAARRTAGRRRLQRDTLQRLAVADKQIVKLHQIAEQVFGGADVVTIAPQLVDQALLAGNVLPAFGDMYFGLIEPLRSGGKFVFLIDQELAQLFSRSRIDFGLKPLRKSQDVLLTDEIFHSESL
jgi:hypothetical protein